MHRPVSSPVMSAATPPASSYTYEVPSAYLLLGAGTPQEDPRYGKPMHNEAVVFNEDVLPTGAALHTLFALRMLAQET